MVISQGGFSLHFADGQSCWAVFPCLFAIRMSSSVCSYVGHTFNLDQWLFFITNLRAPCFRHLFLIEFVIVVHKCFLLSCTLSFCPPNRIFCRTRNLNFFCGAGGQTQSLVQSRQVFSCWSISQVHRLSFWVGLWNFYGSPFWCQA